MVYLKAMKPEEQGKLPMTLRIFIYEETCGGGCEDPLPLQLRGEGMAMLRALCEDFMKLENVEPITTLDKRMDPGGLPLQPVSIASPGELTECFDDLAAQCDLSLILAPELGGRLAELSNSQFDMGFEKLNPANPSDLKKPKFPVSCKL